MSGNYVYLLRCADDTLYAGWTTDPIKREKVHNAGKGARYTRSRLPVKLVYCEACDFKSEALKREIAIKKLSRDQKQALIRCESQNLITELMRGSKNLGMQD